MKPYVKPAVVTQLAVPHAVRKELGGGLIFGWASCVAQFMADPALPVGIGLDVIASAAHDVAYYRHRKLDGRSVEWPLVTRAAWRGSLP